MISARFAQLFTVFGLSALTVWILTFGVRRFSLRFGVVAKKSARRRHEKVTPLLGGASIYIVLMSIVLASGLFFKNAQGSSLLSLREAIATGIAISIIFAVGVIDDWVELSGPPKLLAEVCATFVFLAGMDQLPTMFESMGVSQSFALPLLIFWVTAVTNATNMIDGLDGLCAGISAISAFTLAMVIVGLHEGVSFHSMLMMGLAGACVGFLVHNYNPAKIFLGDSGSLLIGFTLAIVSSQLELKRSLLVSLTLPVILMGLPILDVVLSVVRRTRLERSWFKGDRGHIHHRLLQIGLSQRGAVILMWTCAAYLNLNAYFMAQIPHSYSFYFFMTSFPAIGFWVLSLYYIEKRLSLQAARYSSLFVKSEDGKLRDPLILRRYLQEQVTDYELTGKPFTVVVVDCAEFLKEMSQERPYRLISFYMGLHQIFKERVRESDYIARVNDHRFVAFLSGLGSGDGSEFTIIDYLRARVRELQESYGVFQTHPVRPEGFRVLKYPKDQVLVFHVLNIEGSDIKHREATYGRRVA